LTLPQQDNQAIEHLLGIFASLLRLLSANSPERIRTLAKFVEKDYEKLSKVIALRRDYSSRLKAVEENIKAEQQSLSREGVEEMADEWYSRRLDAGLFCLQVRLT